MQPLPGDPAPVPAQIGQSVPQLLLLQMLAQSSSSLEGPEPPPLRPQPQISKPLASTDESVCHVISAPSLTATPAPESEPPSPLYSVPSIVTWSQQLSVLKAVALIQPLPETTIVQCSFDPYSPG